MQVYFFGSPMHFLFYKNSCFRSVHIVYIMLLSSTFLEGGDVIFLVSDCGHKAGISVDVIADYFETPVGKPHPVCRAGRRQEKWFEYRTSEIMNFGWILSQSVSQSHLYSPSVRSGADSSFPSL